LIEDDLDQTHSCNDLSSIESDDCDDKSNDNDGDNEINDQDYHELIENAKKKRKILNDKTNKLCGNEIPPISKDLKGSVNNLMIRLAENYTSTPMSANNTASKKENNINSNANTLITGGESPFLNRRKDKFDLLSAQFQKKNTILNSVRNKNFVSNNCPIVTSTQISNAPIATIESSSSQASSQIVIKKPTSNDKKLTDFVCPISPKVIQNRDDSIFNISTKSPTTTAVVPVASNNNNSLISALNSTEQHSNTVATAKWIQQSSFSNKSPTIPLLDDYVSAKTPHIEVDNSIASTNGRCLINDLQLIEKKNQ
jgi:hypothetical protein